MPSVKVSPYISNPTHDIALEWQGNIMGFSYENGETSLMETPASPSAVPFQWKQSTWEGGRANARSITDQTAYFDANSMYGLTPEVLHPTPQWGIGTGLISSDEYCPQARNISWKPLLGSERLVASSFVAGSSYSATRLYIWVRPVGNPDTLYVALWSNSASKPNAQIQGATLTAASLGLTDSLSSWKMLAIPAGAIVSGTAYWIVAGAQTTDTQNNHWEVGIDAAPVAFSEASANGSSWATQTYDMYFRCAESITKAVSYPFFYMGSQYVIMNYANAAASKIFINGDMRKASAGTSTTITATAAGGISWATNALAGGWVNVIAGTGDRMTPRQITSNTSGTTPVITVSPAFEITPDATTIFCVYGVAAWKQITSPAPGIVRILSAPAVGGKTVYIPQSGNIRRMYFNAATGAYVFADDGTNRADYIRPINGDIVAVRANTASATASTSPMQTQGTNLAFTGATNVGTSDYRPTGMCDYGGVMYIGKEDGLYKLVNGRTTRINYGGENLPSLSNGKVMITLGDSMYFSFLHSLERMTNNTIDDIGWWRHEGMVSGREGVASCATTFLSWIFVGINAGENGTSSVLCWNGFGWHEIFRAFSDNYRVSGISLQPCAQTRPRLWIFIENEAFYLDFPRDAINPLKDSGMVYMHESSIVTSTIDLGKVNFTKIFRDLVVQTKNLSSKTSIFIDYQKDNDIGGTTWTPTNEGKGMYLSPISSVPIKIGKAYLIRLRLRFYTETATVPPVLYGVQLNGNSIEPPRYQWNATIQVGNTKQNDFSPNDVKNWLLDASQNMRLLEAFSTNETLHGRFVYVSQPTTVAQSRNTQTKKWTGRIVFTIREA